MTVKVTGYQWMWKYEYLGEGVSYTSRLARRSDDLRQSGGIINAAQDPNYLLEVDHPLVLPVGTKVRFVVTADDVIHAWWVPALGWKQDAIPGIVNGPGPASTSPASTVASAPSVRRDHGFMPVVVKAVTKAEFAQWLAAEKAKNAPPTPPRLRPRHLRRTRARADRATGGYRRDDPAPRRPLPADRRTEHASEVGHVRHASRRRRPPPRRPRPQARFLRALVLLHQPQGTSAPCTCCSRSRW